MKAIGVVSRLEGDKCYVNIERNSACGEKCASCGLGCKTQDEIVAINEVKAKENDKVLLYTKDRNLLLMTLLVYLLPIIVLIISYIVSYSLTKNETTSIFLCITIFILSFVFIKFCDNKLKNNEEYYPRAIKVLHNNTNCDIISN